MRARPIRLFSTHDETSAWSSKILYNKVALTHLVWQRDVGWLVLRKIEVAFLTRMFLGSNTEEEMWKSQTFTVFPLD